MKIHILRKVDMDPLTQAQVDACPEAIILSLSPGEMEQENNISSEISNKAEESKISRSILSPVFVQFGCWFLKGTNVNKIFIQKL
ncbi:hypothetical protein ACET3Z_015666 [Daucus carota]